MDYSSQHGLSRFSGRKMMVFLYVLLFWGNVTTQATTVLKEGENVSGNQPTAEVTKSEITKREEPEAQRRDHSFNSDGTVNYHGSGSGHDSGDLIPPPGGSVFNSPSIELSVGHTGASGPGLSNSYGLPIPDDTYGPPKNFFNSPSQQYGPPNNKYLPPPKPVYGPPKPSYRPPSPPKPVYGPPVQFRPPKTSYSSVKPIRKPSFSSRPKPVYGPPKNSFGDGFSHGTRLSPVSNIKSQYGPPKISATYGTPLQPSTSYGVPKHQKHISAPPTPPVVKYDGWKPMPGLVSNAPSGSYGPPDHGFSSGHGVDFSSAAQISAGGFDGFAPPSGSYGAPFFGGSSFGSSGFGISSAGSFGPSKPSISYGTPLQPSSSYGPPSHKGSSKLNFLSSIKPPSPSYGPPKAPSSSYGVPSSSYGPPKPPGSSYGPPKPPSFSYGPPKPPSISFAPVRAPSSSYGPPKPPSSSYGPPKAPSSSYGPPSFSVSSFGTTGISGSFTPPKIPSSAYGPPKPPSSSYGPPKAPSSSYGPPKAPSSSYGPPKAPNTAYGPPQVFTTYSIPKPSGSVSATPSTAYRGPPVPHPLQPPSAYGPPSFQGGLYKTPLPPNALYGVPTAPAVGFGGDAGFQFQSSGFNAPLPDLHAPAPFLSTGPSPVFSSALPSTSYGTPLLPSSPASIHPPASTYGVPTALPLRQPKNPVKFRPPVPPGLISSIGAKWGDSAAWGGATSHSHNFHENTYIPPAVPDPDPGIHANKGNPLVIPPPPAPPINYGPPQPNQFVSTAASHSSGDSGLYPPPPPPPPTAHAQGNFDIQQSASVELPSSNNLDHGGAVGTSYNAPIETHQPTAPSVPDFGGVQNIPIKGTQGSYTLQIQSAGGNSGEHIPHSEVLSNGLLQDILAAIENPTASGKLEQYGGQQSSDPVASEIGLNILKQLGGNAQQSNSIQYGSDLSHASSSNVPLYSKTNEIPPTSPNATEGTSEVKIGNYLSENKIAFYYNNQQGIEDRKGDGKDILLVQMLLPNNSTSSQSEKSEFDALVSIKIQNAQNGGEVHTTNATVTKRRDDGS